MTRYFCGQCWTELDILEEIDWHIYRECKYCGLQCFPVAIIDDENILFPIGACPEEKEYGGIGGAPLLIQEKRNEV